MVPLVLALLVLQQLLFLLPVAGLEGVAKGLMSANVFARQRRMKLRGVAIIQWAGAIATCMTACLAGLMG